MMKMEKRTPHPGPPHEPGRSAGFPACGFTGLSSPVFRNLGTGDWKPNVGLRVARTRRLESLRYSTTAAPVQGFKARMLRGNLSPLRGEGSHGSQFLKRF